MNVNQAVYNNRINEIKAKSPNTPANTDNNTYGYLDSKSPEAVAAAAAAAKKAAEAAGGTDVSEMLTFPV